MANSTFEHRGVTYTISVTANNNSVLGGGAYQDKSVTITVNNRQDGFLDFQCPVSVDALVIAKQKIEAWIDSRLDTGRKVP